MKRELSGSNSAAIIAIVAGVIVSASIFKLSANMNLIMEDFGVNYDACGILLTICTLVGIVLALPAGGIVSKKGPKFVGVIIFALTALGSLIGAFANNLEVLMVSRFFEGFGLGLTPIVVQAIISMVYPLEKRGLPMAIWMCGWSGIGLLIALNLSNMVVDASDPSSWHRVWLIMAVAVAIATIVFAVFLRMPKLETSVEENKEQISDEKVALTDVLKNPTVWILSLIMFGYSWISMCSTNYLPSYLQSGLGYSVSQATTYASIYTITAIIGGIVAGAILNRIRNYNRMLLISAVLTAIIGAFMFSYQDFWALGYLIAAGIIIQLLAPTLLIVAPESAKNPNMIGMIMGVITEVQMIGAGLSTTVVGVIMTKFGYAGASVLMGGCGVVSIIGVLIYLYMVKNA